MSLRDTPAPDVSDVEANLRWLRDREQLKMLYQRYAYGVDTGNSFLSQVTSFIEVDRRSVAADFLWQVVFRNIYAVLGPGRFNS